MVKERMDLLELMRKRGVDGDVDFLREALRVLVEEIMEADVSSRTGAGYGERNPERVTQRNGYRSRAWDTRVGTMELQIPKLREGSYFPSLLEPRRRSERALLVFNSKETATHVTFGFLGVPAFCQCICQHHLNDRPSHLYSIEGQEHKIALVVSFLLDLFRPKKDQVPIGNVRDQISVDILGREHDALVILHQHFGRDHLVTD